MKQYSKHIEKVRTANNYYIYDVQTNQILKVDKVLFDIIDYFGLLTCDQIYKKLKRKYSKDTINEYLLKIKNYSELEFTFSNPPSE